MCIGAQLPQSFTQSRLPYSRRTYEAYNLSHNGTPKLSNGYILEYPFLYVFKSIMVLIYKTSDKEEKDKMSIQEEAKKMLFIHRLST